jgi:PilZ domain
MFTGLENPQARKTAEIGYHAVNLKPMVITSNYKGVILTQPVQVLNIMPDRVIFQAPVPPLCFTLKEKVYLYSRTFREIVSARLLNKNTVLGRLELADLTFTGWPWNERQSDRVEPRDPIIVEMGLKKAQFQVTLDNLSMKGMSLLACTYKEKALLIGYAVPVHLTFQLPDEGARLCLKGKVIRARQVGRMVIIGVQLMANSVQEKHIHHYVAARKAEILAELKRTFLCDGGF